MSFPQFSCTYHESFFKTCQHCKLGKFGLHHPLTFTASALDLVVPLRRKKDLQYFFVSSKEDGKTIAVGRNLDKKTDKLHFQYISMEEGGCWTRTPPLFPQEKKFISSCLGTPCVLSISATGGGSLVCFTVVSSRTGPPLKPKN